MQRSLIAELDRAQTELVVLKGWIRRIRETKSTTFIVLQDCSGIIQIVANPAIVKDLGLRPESAVAITGTLRGDERAPSGIEIDCHRAEVLNPAAEILPFTATSRLQEISADIAINNRPLALRTDRGGAIFRIEAALAEEFRAALRRRRFTEIFTLEDCRERHRGRHQPVRDQIFRARSAILRRVRSFTKSMGLRVWSACSRPATYIARSRTHRRAICVNTCRSISRWDLSKASTTSSIWNARY